MNELLKYILDSLIGKENYSLSETKEDNTKRFNIAADKDYIGMVIGKNGKVIQAIQEILRLKAKKEGLSVWVNVEEKE